MRRLLGVLRDHEPRLVLAWVLTTLALGVAGLRDYLGPGYSASDLLYQAVQLFVLQLAVVPGKTGLVLDVARWSAAAVSFYAVLRTLSVLFADELAGLRLRRLRGHAVVCGLGRKGLQLALDLRRRGQAVVVVEKDEENDHLLAAREAGALVVLGHAADEALLRRARAHRAELVLAVTGEDGVNIEIAEAVRRLAVDASPPPRAASPAARTDRPARAPAAGFASPPDAPLAAAPAAAVAPAGVSPPPAPPRGDAGPPRIRVQAHVGDLRLCGLLRASRVLAVPGPVEATPWCVHEAAARVLLRDHPLDREPIGPTDPRSVHLVVVGFGQMGESVTLQAARTVHLANGARLRVTIVDRRADERRRRFLGRCPGFPAVADLDAVEGDIEDQEVLSRVEAWGQDPARLLDVVVCFDDDRRGLSCALALVERLRGRRVPVRVRMSQEAGLSALARADAPGGWSGRISVFGLLDRLCTRDDVVGEPLDRLARAAHEDYYRRKLAEGERPGARPSLRPWAELDEHYRESNRQQADHLPVKLRAVGCRAVPAAEAPPGFAFTPAEVELLATMEHARWCARHLLDGWVRGDVRDDAARVHPCLVPWERLAEQFRDNDRAAARQVPALLELVGQRVVRLGPPPA